MFDVIFRCELDLPNLSELKGKNKSAAYRAINRAAKPIREAVINEATRIAVWGFLYKSIGTKTKLYAGSKFMTAIGPKSSYIRKGKKRKSGKHKGEKPVIRPVRFGWLLAKGTRRTRKFDFLTAAWVATGQGAFINRAYAELRSEFAKLDG
jgi:hypothetical protein